MKKRKKIGDMATIWHNKYQQSQGRVIAVWANGKVSLNIYDPITGKPVKGTPL